MLDETRSSEIGFSRSDRKGVDPASHCGKSQHQASPGEEFAAVDRVVDGEYVVFLVGSDEREWVARRTDLPPGWAEGSWLRVTFDDECGDLSFVEVDSLRTSEVQARIAEKVELLRKRSGGLGSR